MIIFDTYFSIADTIHLLFHYRHDSLGAHHFRGWYYSTIATTIQIFFHDSLKSSCFSTILLEPSPERNYVKFIQLCSFVIDVLIKSVPLAQLFCN